MLKRHTFATNFIKKSMAAYGREYEARTTSSDGATPDLCSVILTGSVLDAFVAGRSMIMWKDGEPVLMDVI